MPHMRDLYHIQNDQDAGIIGQRPNFERTVRTQRMANVKRNTSFWVAVVVLLFGASRIAEATSAPFASQASSTAKQAKSGKNEHPADPSQYVGTDTCITCHEEQGKSFDRGPHWKTNLNKRQGPEYQGCEACHGPGKAHSEDGDTAKIIRFGGLS